MTEEDYKRANSDYFEKNPNWHVEDSPWKAKQILKMMNRNKLPVNTIVEIGCGAGEILNQLHQQLPSTIEFTGYDVSPDAIALAKHREKDRLTFKLENLLEADVKPFDLLLMIDVFEHVDDYLGFLKACKDKSVYSIFHIPLDISVLGTLRETMVKYRKSVGHLHYFMKETALATLRDTGYEVMDFFYTAEGIELPRKTMLSKVSLYPRKILYGINEDFAVKLFGGFSLLVLTKNAK
jgi:hypothetical protein